MDCIVIGGGPAGLTAAIYLARFRRAVTVIDDGASRAAWIPVSHNVLGFPDGISGEALLARLRAHAVEYGAELRRGTVRALAREGEGFRAEYDGGAAQAPMVLLATGGLDHEPALPGVRDAVARGLIRYCPICDAYEVTGKRVALIASGACRVREALLLRGYTDDLTVLTVESEMRVTDEDRALLIEAGIVVEDAPVVGLRVDGEAVVAALSGGGAQTRFDVIYMALGTRIRSDLAADLGARVDPDGALVVDRYQRTTVPGLYAAGDVVAGLSQISVAAGQAAVAATRINAGLPFLRK